MGRKVTFGTQFLKATEYEIETMIRLLDNHAFTDMDLWLWMGWLEGKRDVYASAQSLIEYMADKGEEQ